MKVIAEFYNIKSLEISEAQGTKGASERNISFKIKAKHVPYLLKNDPPPRILEIKAKINKWDLIKFISFCTTKETISKVKRQPSDWEKIIANEATDKGLI